MYRAVIFDCTGVLVGADGRVEQRLLQYIRKLRPRFKIALLSNLSAGTISRLFSPLDLLLFDVVSLASETGIAKPDPRAYRLVAERLGVRTDDCIFIDDFPRRCEAAREEGMQPVLYESFEQASRELNNLTEETNSGE